MHPDVTDRLAVAASATSLEALTRPLLELLEEVTGLETTYLTRIDEAADEQLIVFARNVGEIEIPEGLRVDWNDTLCKRALTEGRMCTEDVPAVWGDSQAARDLRLQTYVSAPVTLPDGSLFGTLCGASGSRKRLNDKQLRVLQLFSRIVADQVARERLREEAAMRATLAEQRLRARARLLAMAEHELKTPMAVLVGWSELVREQRDSGLADVALEAMQSAVARLRTQLDRMLDEARAEVIARELDLVALDVAEEAMQALDGIVATHPAGRFVFDLDPVVARGDRYALGQVIAHLVENALKYSPADGRILVSVGARDGGGWIRIRDEGSGIPEGIDLFAPFQRGDTETQGVGLGLHIVRTLTDAMEGQVRAWRNPEVGSTFEVWLPGSGPPAADAGG